MKNTQIKYIIYIILISILIYSINFLSKAIADDDNIYFVYYSFEILEKDSYSQIADEIKNRLPNNADENLYIRYNMRMNDIVKSHMISRYVYASVYYVLSNIIEINDDNFNKFLAVLIPLMFFSSFFLALLIFIIILFLINDEMINIKILITFTIVGILYIMSDLFGVPIPHYGLDIQRIDKIIINAVGLIFRPTDPFFIFGYTSRNNMVFFILLALILRWKQNNYANYFLLMATLIHASMGIIFVIFVITSDILFNYKRIISANYIIPLFISGIILLLNGGVFLNIYSKIENYSTIFLSLVLLFTLTFIILWNYYGLPQKIAKKLKFKNRNISFDLLSFFLVTVFSFILLRYFVLDKTNISNMTFIGAFNGRFIAVMSIVIIYAIVSRYYETIIKIKFKNIILNCIIVILLIWQILCISMFSNRIYWGLNKWANFKDSEVYKEIEKNKNTSSTIQLSYSPYEVYLYYIALKSIILNDKSYETLSE